jgi:lipopolysaccharide transport system permease protein
MLRNITELYQYRALLWSLTQRELKARYRASVLGFLWTFLNPTLQMLTYGLVFNVLLRQQIRHFLFFQFVGLLPWIFFSASIVGGATAISDRRDLLTKVRFPPQVLPATVVATNLSNYLLSLPLMIGLGLIYREWPTWHTVLFPIVVLIQVLFTLGVAYIVSAINVAFRDLQHIVSNVITLWFFLTPVLYELAAVPEPYRHWIAVINPMAPLITAYQAIFYHHQLPALRPLAYVAAVSTLLLWFASQIFQHRREEFAELV